jgi:hypothetical protein
MHQLIRELKLSLTSDVDYNTSNSLFFKLGGKTVLTNPNNINYGTMFLDEANTYYTPISPNKFTFCELISKEYFYLVVVDFQNNRNQNYAYYGQRLDYIDHIESFQVIKTARFSYSNPDSPIYLFIANGNQNIDYNNLHKLTQNPLTKGSQSIEYISLIHNIDYRDNYNSEFSSIWF